VAQRGTSFTGIGSTTFTLDRWEVYPGANPGVITVTQETFGYNDAMLVNEGFTNYLRSEVTTAYTGASYDNRYFRYPIEDVRLLAGKEVTISFWAKASSPTKMGVETRNWDGDTSNNVEYLSPYDAPDGNEFNITTSWQKFTHTFTIPALTTAITGNANATYTKVFLLADTATANLQHDITGVQLELGDTATDFEHRSYGEELALCQRYYQKWHNDFGSSLYNINLQVYAASAAFGKLFDFPVEMRTAPTASASGTFEPHNATGGAQAAFTNLTNLYATTQSLSTGSWTGSSGLVAGNATGLRVGTNAIITLDAEL